LEWSQRLMIFEPSLSLKMSFAEAQKNL